MAASTLVTLQGLIFKAPASIFVTGMTVMSMVVLTVFGVNEVRGKHLQYSKMAAPTNSGAKLLSKSGMTILYLPAFLFAAASFFVASGVDSRFFLIRCALSIHFLKRLLETWCVHKYSGSMTMEAVVIISSSYFTFTLTIIYVQYLSLSLQSPSIDLMHVGLLLFIVGTCGNLYHHYILSTLRGKGDEKEYKIPTGGLFRLVICPHYMFELIAFWGFALIAQTLYALSFAVGTTVYLLGRSHATRNWYVSKFEDFPAHVNSLIPYIF